MKSSKFIEIIQMNSKLEIDLGIPLHSKQSQGSQLCYDTNTEKSQDIEYHKKRICDTNHESFNISSVSEQTKSEIELIHASDWFHLV